MARKIASVQRVHTINSIPGADSIVQIEVLGWKLISRKGEFNPGDMCVFFEIDSILPDGPEWSEFLRPKGFRVKTMKLGKFGVVSQGLALPLSILPNRATELAKIQTPVYEISPHEYLDVMSRSWQEGDDVTEVLGVIKHEVELTVSFSGKDSNNLPFPAGVPKTDEQRIQSNPWILARMYGKRWVASEKMDGTSFTAVMKRDPETGARNLLIASRNFSKVMGDESVYSDIANKYRLEEKLYEFPGLVIQGEIVGPGIQKNPLKLDSHILYIFNVYDMNDWEYWSFDESAMLANRINVPHVVPVEHGNFFDFSIPELEEMAKGCYYGTDYLREGLVFRPALSEIDPILGQLSFKVINTDYLLKTGN